MDFPVSLRIDLPSKQVGVLVAALLVDEQRSYVADFDPGWTEITLSSSTILELSKAEAIIRAHMEQIGHDIRSKTSSLHCANIPLLTSIVGEGEIRSVEDLYHVEITFTRNYIPIQQLQQVQLQLQQVGQSSLLRTLQMRDVTVNASSPSPPLLASPDPVWRHCHCSGAFIPFAPNESRILEDLFQFGGQKILILGNLCAVDFKDMTIRSAVSGEVESLQRIPHIDGLPERHVTLNIKGLESCVTDALSNLKGRLNKRLKSSSIPISQEVGVFSSQLQQQIINCCRQYCIQYSFSSVGLLTITGAEDYVEQVHARLCENVQMLGEEFAMRLHATRQPSPNPPQARAPAQPITDYPRLWKPGQTTNCIFDAVVRHTPEWKEIEMRIRETIATVNVVKIDRVQNCTLWDRYQLEGRHMSARNDNVTNEKYLFHGTTKTDPYEIAGSLNGIDFRCSSRERRLMWGIGAYFAVNAGYSDHFSYKCSDRTRQMMLVSVLTGISCQYGSRKYPDLTRPPERYSGTLYDTVQGESGGSGVYIVYDHLKSCPAYIITYTK